ncbi:hypothetical protein [Pseudocolwellia sp. HL-MZ7]|uniref:hypothetical protein n=1 Tax=Pseudocolwellia sp. HL-MZ7 TaxID=3400627 RepID=UPI003CE9A7CE
MSKPEIECTRVRACKWQGGYSDLTKKLNKKDTKKYGTECNDNVCPKCECKTMYEIKNT